MGLIQGNSGNKAANALDSARCHALDKERAEGSHPGFSALA